MSYLKIYQRLAKVNQPPHLFFFQSVFLLPPVAYRALVLVRTCNLHGFGGNTHELEIQSRGVFYAYKMVIHFIRENL